MIVATVSAIYGIGDPSDYHSMVLTLRHNDRLSQRDIIVRLTQMQYKRSDMEFTRGTFRVRGDTIDIFPQNTPSWRSGWIFTTTRSIRSSCSIH